MELTSGQLKDLIQESSEWRNTEAQSKMQEILEACNNSELLFDAISAYDIVRENGGWRASNQTIKDYNYKVDRFIKDNQ